MFTWDLLHLTDIHYSSRPDDDAKVLVPQGGRDDIQRRFHYLINEWPKEFGLPTALLITGDAVSRGDANAMKALATALSPLTAAMNAASPRRHVCMVPGNHDVQWFLSPQKKDWATRKFAAFRRNLVDPLNCNSCLYPYVDNGGELVFKSAKHKDAGPLLVDRAQRLMVLSINSAVRCGEPQHEPTDALMKLVRRARANEALKDAFQRWSNEHLVFDIAHVTENQRFVLQDILSFQRKEDPALWSQSLRVAILHHHLVPFGGQRTEHKVFEPTIDAQQVLELLASFDFHLILTGHKHHPYCEERIIQPPGAAPVKLIIAGGPTILGETSDVAHGVRRLIVRETGLDRWTGGMTVEIRDIELARQQPIIDAYRAAKTTSKAIRYPKPLMCLVYEDRETIDLNIATESLGRRDTTSVALNHSGDISDEWMLFLNVVSCQKARAAIGEALLANDLLKSLRFKSLYDLYGRYDVLFRFAGPTLAEARVLKSAILKAIKRAEGISPKALLLDVREVAYPVGTEKRHFVGKDYYYEQHRMQRVFMIARRLGSTSVQTGHWQTAEEKVQEALSENKLAPPQRSQWSLHRSDACIVVEGLLRCGQQPDLQKVTRALENGLLDSTAWAKETHVAYYHDEETVHRYERDLRKQIAQVSDHPLIKDGLAGTLSPNRITQWLFCAGKESELFTDVLDAAIKAAGREHSELKAALKRNLRDERGNGDPQEAHFRHYLRLLREVGFDERTFAGFVPEGGLAEALRVAQHVIESQDPALLFGYLIVNEALTQPIYAAVKASFERSYAGIPTTFFDLHIQGDHEHVEELHAAGARLPPSTDAQVIAGIKLGADAMLQVLQEAYSGSYPLNARG